MVCCAIELYHECVAADVWCVALLNCTIIQLFDYFVVYYYVMISSRMILHVVYVEHVLYLHVVYVEHVLYCYVIISSYEVIDERISHQY